MHKTKTINSTEIARLAGVSRSTVSKVINNYQDIPEETKNRIRAVITEYGYVPNASAQVLKGKAQTVIALYIYISETDAQEDVMCGASSPYVMSIISSFISSAEQYGHRLMIEILRHTDSDTDLEQRVRGHFESKSISSAVFHGIPDSRHFIDSLVSQDFPVAVIDRKVDNQYQASSIFTSDRLGAEKATLHLAAQGFKNILHITGDSNKRSAQERMLGYQGAIEQLSLEPLILEGAYSEITGYQLADEILMMCPRPDAITCASDALAYGVIKRLKEVDGDYLDSIGLIGFDDSYFNDFQQPPLSSVKIDFATMAKLTVQALLDKDNYQPQTIPVELSIRASSLKK